MDNNNLVYLTGATGFVGRHVLTELISQGYQVHCIISGNRFINELNHPQVKYSEIDLLADDFEEKVNVLFTSEPAPYLLHGAWYTEHDNYLTNTINTRWADSSKKLINAFYRNGGKKFIGLGTCIEYDFTYINGKPISVKTPLKGNTLYAKSKLEVFNHLQYINTVKGIDFIWARLFFIYGPYDKKGRLIPYIYEQMASNHRAIPRFGGAIRDYIYVKDLSKQLVSLIKSNFKGAINLGTEGVYRIQDIFETVGKIMSKRHLVVKNDVLSHNTEYEPHSIVADLTEWHSLENKIQFTPLAEGLRQTIAWMDQNMSIK